ncbi:MAG: hypothetical protein IID08_01695 [Candidatus Hydrogenedentes bacterium]|nr:hypothetical protein [Candidatus Hydrogenedentota bacterium]
MSDETTIRNTLTPWKVALWGSSLGLLFSVLFAIFPALHRVPLPGGVSLPTLYIVVLLPVIATAWAVVGIVRRKRDANVVWCYFSILLSLFALAFDATAVWMETIAP